MALLGAGLLLSAPADAAPRRKTAPKAPAIAVVVPLPITCGVPLAAAATPAKPEKKGIAGKLKDATKGGGKSSKLPEACVLARFADAAYPLADAASPGQPAASLLGGTGPMPAAWPVYTAALQQLVDRLADAGPRPDVRARVVVVADRMEDARAFFQKPGAADGVIVVTTGLLARLYVQSQTAAPQTQEHLRFFLAHQYAHLVLKHPQRLDDGKGGYDQMAQALQLANMGLDMAQGSPKGGKSDDAQQKVRNSADIILAAAFVSDLEAGEPARYRFPEFDKAVERDADLLAADILARKGADGRTGARGLRWVWDDNRGNIQANALLRDQAAKTSAKAAQDIASLAQVKNAPVIMQKAQLMAASYVAGIAMKKLEERREMVAVHLHDDADDRAEAVGAYLDAFYPDPAAAIAATPAGRVPLPVVDFTRARPEIEGYRAAGRAEAAISRGDVAGARAEIDAALKSPVAGNADVQILAAAVAMAEDRPDVSTKHLRAVLAIGYRAPLVYQKLAVNARTLGSDAAALAVLAEGATALSDPRPFILDRLGIYKIQGDAEGLAAALRDCSAMGDVALTMNCQRVGLPDGDKGKGGVTVAGGQGTMGKMMSAAGNLSQAVGATQPRAAVARVEPPLPPDPALAKTAAKKKR